MIELRIRHRTTYTYRRSVSSGPHRLMLRPRESRDLRLISSEINVKSAGALAWAHDAFGNAVATVTFSAMTDVLVIDATAELELHAAAWPVFDIAASAIEYPFRYSDDEWTDLGATTVQQYADPHGRLRRWARDFVSGDTERSADSISSRLGSLATSVRSRRLLAALSATATGFKRCQ